MLRLNELTKQSYVLTNQMVTGGCVDGKFNVLDDEIEGKVYFIDNTLLFFPEKNELYRDDGMTIIKLQKPASRCLELLLSQQGKVISQSDLISYGWGEERSRYITTNAFYQSMYHLRQSLEKVGYPEIIYTIPRQGSGIAASLDIRIIQSKERDITEGKSGWQYYINKKNVIIFCTWGIFLSVVVFIITNIMEYSRSSDNGQLYKVSNCLIYSHSNEITFNLSKKLIEQYSIDCTKSTSVSIFKPTYSDIKTMIVCPLPKSKTNKCLSIIIMDKIS